ncbi:unnamed protein product [Cuscuta epithymum]|uniref:Uncharacterized protein n=1 Tax=Cuscuta epithymum TaxID=186058 RepID=A0AAV0CVW9_9ASTE|nr:unnamed protein product [Cuscuta epithymum]
MGNGCRHGSSFLFAWKIQDELPYSAERRRAMDCKILSRVRFQVLPLEPFVPYRLALRSGADFGHSFCNSPDLTYIKGMQQARGQPGYWQCSHGSGVDRFVSGPRQG